jgi:hypothetical protein
MAIGRKTGGRQAGTPNKVTTAFKTAVQIVYEDIGGHKAFAEWARANPGDFYRIASRLIPTEVTNPAEAFGANGITIVISSVEVPRMIDQTQALDCIERFA